MYLSEMTVKQALSDLKGQANSLLKIWLTLKVMGLKKGSPVLVDTSNSASALKLLFNSGSTDGCFYVPFASTSGDAWMKHHAARSIVQTNIKKWHDGTVTTVDPRGYLKISKKGAKYKVEVSSLYPQGLGFGRNGFANASGHSLAVPLKQFAAWVFCRDTIPDSIADVGSYLCDKLRKLLNLSNAEEQCVFEDLPFEISTVAKPLSDGDIFDLCNGRMIQRVVRIMSRQQIRYGAPGTGKSFGLDDEAGENEVYRTTFHPDSDYLTFVGAYKPTMSGEGENAKIVYSFRPQAFMNAYIAAWTAWAQGGEDATKPVVLIIEEINRGNCAQIFGDLFQLLDRSEDGWSSYPIDADADLARWLTKKFAGFAANEALVCPDGIKQKDWEAVKTGNKLSLPPNLCIWATMNTSDQSLFPIDSAFKRRWEWKYVPIAKPTDPTVVERKIVVGGQKYDWWDFISIINAQIADVTKSEDKQLGYFFVKAPKATGEITAEQFANKVLFYLYNDAFKDWDLPMKIFGKASGGKYAFKDFFYAEKTVDRDKAYLPGEVKEAEIAAFIERQEHDGKKIAHEAVMATE